MDFRPNVDAVSWFAEAIWPRIQTEVPEVRFYAVGQQPHPRLDPLRADPNITLTGWVEKVSPYIAAASVYIAPLRMGSGTRLKLLQAMASNKAIVSTRIGAEGLTDVGPGSAAGSPSGVQPSVGAATDGRELILVDDNDADAFADAVVALLRDPDRRTALGSAARAFVKAHYDWSVIVPHLENVYAQGFRTVPRDALTVC
jgi:glycosyltransferase involved in cell wall biosynthesis